MGDFLADSSGLGFAGGAFLVGGLITLVILAAFYTRSEPEGLLALPDNLPDGIQTITVRHEPWRLFVRTLRSGRRIAVVQQTAVRDEITRDRALRTLIPFVVLILILIAIVDMLISRMFKPVKKLASELNHRTEQDLSPISRDQVPDELRPFVLAINGLLNRVDTSMERQRRFVADAAHELRSPLTALSLQAEALDASAMPSQAKKRLATMRGGLHRTRTLLEQLLSLARAQGRPTEPVMMVSMQDVIRRVLEDLIPMAELKGIDVGVTSENDVNLMAREVDLVTLIKNLADNAIRYTPSGGRVDVRVDTDCSDILVQFEDTGPGIPVEERERVFDAFYRVLGNDEGGSGLGLSIVKSIADRMDAKVTLHVPEKSDSSTGLRVVVRIPNALRSA